jgi:hypothetical protein
MSKLEMMYFVLKPKGNDLFAEASRAAMKQYARVIGVDAENHTFRDSLIQWARDEELKALKGGE